MAGGLGAELAEALQLFHRKIVTGEMKHGVKQHGSVPVGEHKAVAIRPLGIARIVAQVALPQNISQRRQCHGRAGMAADRLLHRVHGEGADGVYAQLVKLSRGAAAVDRGGYSHVRAPRMEKDVTPVKKIQLFPDTFQDVIT